MRVVITSLILLVTVSCHFPKPKFGKAFNPTREKIGLETLPETWKPAMVGRDYTVWYNPKRAAPEQQHKAIFNSKSNKYNKKGELVSEQDLYYSGKKFRTIDGEEWEELAIEYYFIPQKVADTTVKGWYCTYISPPHDLDTNSNSNDEETESFEFSVITLAKADSLLRKWGVNPPGRKGN